MKRTNTILAAAFLLVLCLMAGYTLSDFSTIRTTIVDGWHARESQEEDNLLTKLEFAAKQTESTLNAALDREHHFIQLYGGVQKLTRQRFVEDSYSYCVIRMNNGSLTFGSIGQEQKDVTHNAQATADFAAKLGEKGIPFTAVMTPQKVPQHTESVPAALRDYHNEEADQFLAHAAAQGVHCIDLRDDMGTDLRGYFFVTDHHWNADGAFVGNQIMTRLLAEEYAFTPFEQGLNEGNFSRQVYPDLFLGSQGKRVGTLYAGLDDFALYSPEFATHMSYQVSPTAAPRTGTLNEALYFTEHIKFDPFTANPYVTFAGGDWGHATVTNHLNPDGPRVVMIRDSFACAVTPFFALQCSELTTIDLRAYKGEDLLSEIVGLDPDFVVLFYNPSTTVSDNMFEF